MKRHQLALAAITALSGASTSRAETALDPEDAADTAADVIAKEEPPKWDPRSVQPWATQNLRIQGGGGLLSLRNPTDDITVDGFGANVHAHAGDTFFQFLSYYVPVRATLMLFEETTVGGTAVTRFNDKQGLLFESGLGLEVWPWPGVISVAGEGVVNFMSLTTSPVVRAEPALTREAVGGAVRGRVTIQFNGIGLYGEYTRQLVMQDLENGTNWEGQQIFAGLTYHIGEKFDF
jgi:hypothetical protein